MLAAEKENEAAICRLLARRDVNVTLEDKDSRTPLMLAAQKKNKVIVENYVQGGSG